MLVMDAESGGGMGRCYMSALSEHPDSAQAAAEVTAQVLGRLGAVPELAVLFVTPPHRDAVGDIADIVRSVLHPVTLLGAAAVAVLGPRREVEETPAAASASAAAARPRRSAPRASTRGSSTTSSPTCAPSAPPAAPTPLARRGAALPARRRAHHVLDRRAAAHGGAIGARCLDLRRVWRAAASSEATRSPSDSTPARSRASRAPARGVGRRLGAAARAAPPPSPGPAAPTRAMTGPSPARRSAAGAAARGRAASRSSARAVPGRSSQSTTRPFSPCTMYSSWPVTGVTTHVAPLWKPSSGGPNMPSTRESLSSTSDSRVELARAAAWVTRPGDAVGALDLDARAVRRDDRHVPRLRSSPRVAAKRLRDALERHVRAALDQDPQRPVGAPRARVATGAKTSLAIPLRT